MVVEHEGSNNALRAKGEINDNQQLVLAENGGEDEQHSKYLPSVAAIS